MNDSNNMATADTSLCVVAVRTAKKSCDKFYGCSEEKPVDYTEEADTRRE